MNVTDYATLSPSCILVDGLVLTGEFSHADMRHRITLRRLGGTAISVFIDDYDGVHVGLGTLRRDTSAVPIRYLGEVQYLELSWSALIPDANAVPLRFELRAPRRNYSYGDENSIRKTA